MFAFVGREIGVTESERNAKNGIGDGAHQNNAESGANAASYDGRDATIVGQSITGLGYESTPKYDTNRKIKRESDA